MLILAGERVSTPSPAQAVRLLHRADDSRVQLSRKDVSGRWHDRIKELDAADVHSRLPEVLERYPKDLFYRVNSLPTRSRPGYFNAAFADLDVQDLGMPEGEARERLTDAENRGVIPKPSIVAGSGRGLWVYWHLLDPVTGKPPGWTGPAKLVYRRVQGAINDALSDLGAEAKDAERYTRVPGSVNGKSGQPVRYWSQYGSDGRVPAYTMEDLSEFFGTDSATPATRADAKSAPSAFNAQGWARVNASRLRQFETLRSIRGGFGEGMRHHAAFTYARLLYLAGVSQVEMFERVRVLGSECFPPYRPSDCDSTVKGVLRKPSSGLPNRWIADTLDITPEEAAQLDTLPTASRFGSTAEVTATRAGAKARGRLIEFILQSLGGELPPVRRMAEMLREYGHEVCFKTVANDYKRLERG